MAVQLPCKHQVAGSSPVSSTMNDVNNNNYYIRVRFPYWPKGLVIAKSGQDGLFNWGCYDLLLMSLMVEILLHARVAQRQSDWLLTNGSGVQIPPRAPRRDGRVRFIALVLKTRGVHASGGSNPSLSAKIALMV